MELDFSFFGFSPKPKTKNKSTASMPRPTNEDSPKLSLKKKCNLKLGTSSKHEPARTVNELMPTCDNTLQLVLNSCQSNISTEDIQEKENTDPSLPAKSQLTNCKTLQRIQCAVSTSGSDSSRPNEHINITGKKLSADSSSSPLPPKRGLANYINPDVTTIVISDSSTCSNSEAGSIFFFPSDRSTSSTRPKELHAFKDLRTSSSLAYTERKNNIHRKMSSYESLSDALPKSNNRKEYSMSSSVVISTSHKNVLLPSEHHSKSGSSSSSNTTSSSRFNTKIGKNAAIGVIPNIVLETSDSDSEHDHVLDNVLKNSSMFPRQSRNVLNYDKQEGCQTDISGFTQLHTPHMTTSKFQDIQKWLDRSTASASETNVSLVCNSKEISFSCISTTNVTNAEETNSKNILSLSAENVLNQLYGPVWKESSVTLTKQSQTEGRKPSHKLSSKDIDDSFDEFLKKINRNHRPKLPDATVCLTTDFINDDSLSDDSLGFYQGILNSERDIPPGSSQGVGASNNRKLYFSDEEEDTDQPEEINVRVNKKNECTNTQKSAQLKIQANVYSLPVRSFLESLSASTPKTCCHPEAHYFKSNFKKRKEELCVKLFTMYNTKIFGSALPEDLKIEWNVRLQRTAGLCFNRRVLVASGERVRTSRIELSTKVCDSPDRLRDTLIHELCHAATWIVNAVQGGHGNFWKKWSDKAMHSYPELPPIKRCHEYKIHSKFTYKCCGCGYCVDRHSKSLNIDTKRCGYCFGKFELFVNYKNKPGAQLVETPKTPRNPNGFALYVKQNYGSLKSTRKDLKHGDVMKLLGQQFSVAKIS